ncbi:MAG: carboxypeptidase-like regulatory domain-containing protein, partial [Spirochaeta sp.]
MKHVSVKLAFILLGTVMLLATACDFTFNGSFYDISGSVVNIKSADKDSSSYLPDARIIFTNVKNGDEYTTTASSSGSYSLHNLPDGRYRVTGSKDNWTFIPQLYSATGSTSTSDLDIFAYIEEDPTTITVAVAWDNINYDIDLVATYGP